MNKKLKALSTIAAFCISLNHQQASSEEYYWEVQYEGHNDPLGTGVPQPMHSSPEKACRWFLTNWDSDAYLSPPRLSSTFPGWQPDPVYGDRGSWSCSARGGPDDDFWDTWGTLAIVRQGDSCSDGKEFNKINGQCEFISSYEICPSTMTGNPIDFSTGYKIQIETDLDFNQSSQHLNAVKFQRFYNSKDGYWRHSYSQSLHNDATGTIISMPDGSRYSFKDRNSTYEPVEPLAGSLLKTAEGWTYLSPRNQYRYMFNAAGKISEISSKGIAQKISYIEDKIHVTDNYGNEIIFTEDASKQPIDLNTKAISISYTYSRAWQLMSVIRRYNDDVEKTSYLYENTYNDRLLTAIIDNRGVRSASWSYDNKDRATSSEHAKGTEKVSIRYNDDGSSTVTNELGKLTTYRFKLIKGVKRLVAVEGEPTPDCPKSNSSFTYDDQGLLTAQTDNNGNVTAYEYNDQGQELYRTEASGTSTARTVSTKWHPSLALPITITEPRRVIRYTYDDHGRQLSQTISPR